MRIVYYPDPVLLRPAAAVETLPPDLDAIVDGMREVMQLERGIGLAAPQVGLSLRLILVNPTGEAADEKVLLNPEISRFFGKKVWGEEGCLSFPRVWGEVLRHSHVEVKFRTVTGTEESLVAEDLLARVLQHEIDHLNGQVFVNKMRPADRIAAKARLQELKDQFEAQKTSR